MTQLPDFPYKLPNAQWKKNALIFCVHWDSICYFIKYARIFYWGNYALAESYVRNVELILSDRRDITYCLVFFYSTLFIKRVHISKIM